MEFARANGITLHFRQDGAGDGMPLVFLHSLGCDLRIWDGVAARLTPHYRIVRIDSRGHGLSDCPRAPYTVEDFAEDVNALLDRLSTERVVLIGISIGGQAAMQTALMFPERVGALVLCDSAAKIATAEYWDERISNLRMRGMAAMAETIMSRWFAPSFAERHPAAVRGYYNLLTRTPLEGYIGSCAALGSADLGAAVGEIAVPTLVLCGAEDAATPPDLGRELANSLPNAHFDTIADAGHTICVEQPEATAAAIAEFMKAQTL